MTPDDLKALIDTYGTDLAKWPHDQRVAAALFRERSELAQDLFVKAEAFTALLKSPEPALPPQRRQTLVDSIMDRLDRGDAGEAGETSDDLPPPLSPRRRGGLGALLVGVIAGALVASALGGLDAGPRTSAAAELVFLDGGRLTVG